MPRAVMRIVLTDDNRVQLHGPLDDWLTCYGMLEEAKRLVAERAASRVSTEDDEVNAE